MSRDLGHEVAAKPYIECSGSSWNEHGPKRWMTSRPPGSGRERPPSSRSHGFGPPILLLHGFPQTHLMWRAVAPLLVRDFTVVCADLRGYGRSGCPPSTPDHAPYAKRAMARDMVTVMERLGFPLLSPLFA